MTDHTCNGGCARCVPEMDYQYWLNRYEQAQKELRRCKAILQSTIDDIAAMRNTPPVD